MARDKSARRRRRPTEGGNTFHNHFGKSRFRNNVQGISIEHLHTNDNPFAGGDDETISAGVPVKFKPSVRDAVDRAAEANGMKRSAFCREMVELCLGFERHAAALGMTLSAYLEESAALYDRYAAKQAEMEEHIFETAISRRVR
ncbi:hypothetical protein DENIS_3494 [Desulfonema ishimotonii]|uniref:Uncharacterized protein n=1 Tax=Desulfonema ishimotonii TaxID=45657 RepID=A0A401FZV8_9BACT|nr:hypothetical protein [Desulfonema ishimotonii]GBC62522.1 hypothetical protein DENIS_3494 [Desulfonema ishimotonii]